MRLLLSALLIILMVTGAEGACRTITLPNSNGTSGDVLVPPGGYRPIEYFPPVGATSVGLEFWFHQFSAASPVGTQYLLVYLNRPDAGAQRIFHVEHVGSETTGETKSFPMSTFVNPGEHFIVGWLNNTPNWQSGRLIVTVRECM